MRRLLLLALLISCKEPKKSPPPPPAPVVAEKVKPPSEAPLDPVRVSAEAANRDALDRMSRAIGCPQTLPSQLTRYCAAAHDFVTGTTDGLAEGDTLLVGEVTFIQPGAPNVATLGTPMPVVLRLHRDGMSVGAKQLAFRAVPTDKDALAVVTGRIGKAIDGKWDHVEVPASLSDQVNGFTGATDPLEIADHAYWPKDMDGMELRRANGRWILVAAPKGPEDVHLIGIFADKMKVLGPKEKSTQTITVVHI
jgi:hypothetical protein